MINRLKFVVNIVIVALLFLAVAINKDGRIFGTPVAELFESTTQSPEGDESIEVETMLWDGTRVVNSESLAEDVVGFAGRTPVTLYIKGDVIERVEAQENDETPSFFKKVVESGFLDSWNNVPLADAASLKVDMVSGATYSSVAVAENVKRAVAYSTSVEPKGSFGLDFSLKSIAGLLVILIGVALTFMRIHSHRLYIVQMVLNVVVLGFWCGSFLSMAQIVSWMSNGFNLSVAFISFILLLVVILMPIFGRKGSYCHIHCPMGSAQELLGQLHLPQIGISPKVNKILNRLRYYIFMAMLLLMWLGVGFELMDYEVFTAFMISSASNVVMIMAALFLILSLFVKRPYCRFVCPTGAMITIMQKTK